MTLKQARRRLEKLGFEFNPIHKTLAGPVRMGFRKPEKINLGKDHFMPMFRTVWIGAEARGRCRDTENGINFLVSGSLKGKFRGYRCRNEYEREFNYVSGLGRTLEEAVNNFVSDFNSKVK